MNGPVDNQESFNSVSHHNENSSHHAPSYHPVQPESHSDHLHGEISQQRDLGNSAAPYSKQHQIQEQHSRGKDLKNQDEQLNYYNQFCRLYLTNTILTAQLKQLSIEKNQLVSKLNRIEKRAQELSEGNSGHVDQKKKRVRRSASEIARHYKCQVEGCNKSYGSEGSLNQHLKIKHVELFRTMNTNYLANNGTVKQSEEEDESM